MFSVFCLQGFEADSSIASSLAFCSGADCSFLLRSCEHEVLLAALQDFSDQLANCFHSPCDADVGVSQ